jgi:hypothetical protein
MKVREIKKAKFERDLKDGKYEAQSDVTPSGYVEIRRPNGKREWVVVR